jgi:cation:H+ antiporter
VDFGIPSAVVGLTVAAIGTSFANLWSSLIEARRGKVEMAVANALGSNIQNVFLALAVPWALRLTLLNPDGATSISLNADGLVEGVAVMGATLAALVAATVFIGEPWTIDKRSAKAALFVYAAYLASACAPSFGIQIGF